MLRRSRPRWGYVEDCFDFSGIGDLAIYLKLELGLLIGWITKTSKGFLEIGNVVRIDKYRHKSTKIGRTPRFFYIVQPRMVDNVGWASLGLSSPIDWGRRRYIGSGIGYLHENTKEIELQTKVE